MRTALTLWSRLVRFAVTGGLAFALNLSITVSMHELLGVSEELAFAVALVTVFVFTFASCRYFIFPGVGGSMRRQIVLFAVSSLGFRCAEYVAFLVVHSVIGVGYVVAVVAVLAVSFVSKFIYYTAVVFADRS